MPNILICSAFAPAFAPACALTIALLMLFAPYSLPMLNAYALCPFSCAFHRTCTSHSQLAPQTGGLWAAFFALHVR
eukprot:CAMPEP_0119299344 /NCGR_PEP_ID=MMETSP1333-20130426/1414_1 /TAXON_ID=418940 /ORGANISM="Scyphosphaera apsteinii, Strain RCC1455" /LENGTH=75 /DNA_ID=CAMNT_0007300729 /DNA_START=441 /DNA_END=664 /DNA_ORIENTATION=-